MDIGADDSRDFLSQESNKKEDFLAIYLLRKHFRDLLSELD